MSTLVVADQCPQWQFRYSGLLGYERNVMLTAYQHKSVTVVEMDNQCGSFHAVANNAMLDLLSRCSQIAEPPLMVIDLSRTRFFGAAFVGALIQTWKSLKRRGGRLAICNLTPLCYGVLRAARLGAMFEIYPSRHQALAAFAAL